MSEEEKKKSGEGKEKEESSQISRREFLKDAGLVVGGATIGSMAILSACSGGSGSTTTVTQTVTKTATGTAPGGTSTVTVTSPPQTKIVESAVEGLITLVVNGKATLIKVQPNWTLLYVLREKLGLTGTKRGCDEGSCGVCTLIMDNRPILACLALAIQANNKKIETIEGLATTDLHPIQKEFIKKDAMQCGFCAPGGIMMAKALLDFNPKPTADLVKEGLANNLCRCGSYAMIVSAVLGAAGG